MKINPSDHNPPTPLFLFLSSPCPFIYFCFPLFLLPVVGTGDVIRSGREYLHFSPVTIRVFFSLLTEVPIPCLENAVTTLWMTCCINQCLKIMILKLFKLKTEKKDFGCLPWVGYLLESHAVELLKKVHMELSPLMFFFKKITCWIYQYNGIYIFSFFFFLSLFLFWFLATPCIHDSTKMSKLCTREANPAT